MGLADVWTSPNHFPIRIEPWGDRVVFVPLTRSLYRTLTFLDDRYVPMDVSWEASLRSLAHAGLADTAHDRRPVHAIFHVAFCGSTFVSRCLDRLSGAFVLKEPFPVHDIGFVKRHDPLMHHRPEDWTHAFDVLMRLLARTYADDQVAIMKPTDASTHLIGDVLAHAASSSALFLYVDLKVFLQSVLGDRVRRGFVRERLDDLSVLVANHPLFQASNRRGLTDAESAACLWLLHAQLFVDFVAGHPDARCRSLDFATYLGDPARTLEALTDLFEIPAGMDEIERAVRAERDTHAKAPEVRFTRADRDAALRAVSDAHEDELNAGLQWADRARAAVSFPDALPRPLEIA